MQQELGVVGQDAVVVDHQGGAVGVAQEPAHAVGRVQPVAGDAADAKGAADELDDQSWKRSP